MRSRMHKLRIEIKVKIIIDQKKKMESNHCQIKIIHLGDQNLLLRVQSKKTK
jgi:hypothetical protein